MRSIGWVAGLPLLAGLWLGGTLWAESALDADLGEDAAGVAEAHRPDGAEPWLRVERRGRDLVAFGEAPDAAERRAALDRLAALPGPRRIVDRLGTVEPVSPFVWTATLRGGGRLDLAGFRPAETGRAALLAALSPAIPDTLAVRDLARAARGAPPGFVQGATFVLRQMARLRPGATGSLSDRTLSLQGEAASVADYAALREALSAPPDGFAVGTVAVEPAQADRFVWSATRRPDGALRLDGYAVSEAARAAILAAARAAADGAPVEDGMRIARGLPPGLDGRALTERAFAALALLREGTVVARRRRPVGARAGDRRPGPARGRRPHHRQPAGGHEPRQRRPHGERGLALRRHGPARRRQPVARRAPARCREPGGPRRRPAPAELRRADHRPHPHRRGGAGGPRRALRGAIPVLGQLARGELVARDASLSLTGESLYPEAARRLAGLGPQLAPAGWTATVTVAAPEATGAAGRRGVPRGAGRAHRPPAGAVRARQRRPAARLLTGPRRPRGPGPDLPGRALHRRGPR